MQIRNTQPATVFKPVTLNIVLETPEELKGFATVCNYTPIISAGLAVGIDLAEFFDALPPGGYNRDTWKEDVAPAEEILKTHPLLQDKTNIAIHTGEEAIDLLEHIFGVMDDDEDEDDTDEIKAELNPRITCELVDIENYKGTIKVSDGRTYRYQIANCGVAIKLSTTEGTPITEVPMTVKGNSTLSPADIEVIETVFSKIS